MVAGVPAFIAASDIDPPICPPEPTPTINPPKGGAVFEQLSYDLKGALRGSKAFLDTGFLKGSTPAGGLGVAKALGRYGTASPVSSREPRHASRTVSSSSTTRAS